MKPFSLRPLRVSLPSFIAVALLAIAPLSPVFAEGFSDGFAGSYLAATQADFENDHQAAARYYTRALVGDPDNMGLMQNLVFSNLAAGDVKSALPVARRLEALGAGSQLAQLVLLADAIKRGNFDEAQGFFSDGADFSPLLDGLLQGWLALGQGNMSEAIATFDTLAENETMELFGLYHKALALAVVGDFEAAEKIFSGDGKAPLRINRGSIVAHVQILSQLDRNDEALALVDRVLNGASDSQFQGLRDRLQAGETLGFDFISSAKAGAGEVFFTLAAVLSTDENMRFALTYGRLAEYLRPNSVDDLLLVAEILSSQGQYDLAVRSYNKVPSDSPMFYSAEIGRADALMSADKPDAAIEVLRGLTKAYSDNPTVFVSLGDALRRQSEFGEASEAYTAAIKLLPEANASQWFLYYARGITFEREGEWDKAEADFRYSLELSPDQPLVLNYLGYGLVEKRIKLEEAQAMIETAVAQRPNDGYITDSLGWVLYRVGKFKQAVPHMERAAELMPVDPIINDHLGDVYWMVGRKLEAAFQWRRALSFEPEEEEAIRIRRKLEVGLDAVLKMESEKSSADGN